MKLSIIIPCYNEKETILTILEQVQSAPVPSEITEKEIVIVDDFSKDGTRDILAEINEQNVRIFYHKKNQGKGAALRSGFVHATGDIVIIQDADLEYDPNEYSRLLDPILHHGADVVYGSRYVGGQSHRILYFWHTLMNKSLTLFSNVMSDLNLTDMETCYKVFRRHVLDEITIEEDRFGFEPEITAKIGNLAKQKRLVLFEVGISYYGRTFEDGKKIGPLDGLRALWCIYKYNTRGFASVFKYGFNGLIVALTQLVLMIAIVELGNVRGITGQNIATFVSIELATILAFFLHAFLTWRQKFDHPLQLVKTLLYFHLLNAFTIAVRIGMFYFLSIAGMPYLPNTLLGILVFIVLNFLLYDRVVFREKLQRVATVVTRGGGLLETFLAKQRADIANQNIPELLRKGTILDIGCGSVPYFLSSIRFATKIGVEKSIPRPESFSPITILSADIERDARLPLEDSSIDVVTMLAVLEHIEPVHVPIVLQEIKRLLRPTGVFIFTTPAKWTDKLLRTMAKVGLVSKEEIEEHKDVYTPDTLHSLLTDAGFSSNNIQLSSFEMGMNIIGKVIK